MSEIKEELAHEVGCDCDGCDSDFPDEGFIGLKWIAEGAETLSDVADHLEVHARYLRALEKAGAQLIQPMDNGIGLYLPNIEPSPEHFAGHFVIARE